MSAASLLGWRKCVWGWTAWIDEAKPIGAQLEAAWLRTLRSASGVAA